MSREIILPPPPSETAAREEIRVAITNAIVAFEDRYATPFVRTDGGFGDPTDAYQTRSEFLAAEPATLRDGVDVVFDSGEELTEKFVSANEVLNIVRGLVDDVGDDIANKPCRPTLPVPYSRF